MRSAPSEKEGGTGALDRDKHGKGEKEGRSGMKDREIGFELKKEEKETQKGEPRNDFSLLQEYLVM